ncbi:PAS domain-containing hybrid sensor histidine kinase/response regulator [Azospirillum griseum]|uniref:histidine kinase n=1 Tax=Azospirillum griseum TaxID=2496639 RepID=A0A3S0I2B9_9PROT|nr:PAS domain-containing hybrid sensor histidine kinase/response regulator [Azospirillum griseum]RTR22060.1 PAS domain-containing sensor histidine kinase [Azospirillum griseum]
MKILPQSLGSRLFLLYAAVLLMALGTGLFLFYRYHLYQRLEDVQATATVLTDVMARTIQESVIIGDYDTVKRMLETVVSQTPFDRAAFIDLSGATILVGAEGQTRGYVPPWLLELLADRLFDVNRVIAAGGQDYGVLRLSFDIATAAEELWGLTKAALGLALASLLLGLTVVRILLMRWLTNLSDLKALEERIRVGELDAQAQLTQDAPLEIRQAIEMVNRTAASLRNQFGQRIDALMDALVQHKNALDQTAIVSEIDGQGRISVVNDLYCDTVGVAREQAVGQAMRSGDAPFLPPDGVWRGDVCTVRGDGSPLWLSRTVVPIYDSARAIEKWICIDVDISAQKQAEEDLRTAYRESQELAKRHLKAILDAVGEGVVIADRNGVILDVNRATVEIFAADRAALVGASLNDLVVSRAAAATAATVASLTGPPPAAAVAGADADGAVAPPTGDASMAGRSHEEVGRRGDGALFPIELALGDLNAVGIPQVIGIIRDITERKKYEETLQLAKEMAEAGSRAKSDFLTTISHEIRTPMNGVLGMLTLLEYEALAPDLRDKVLVARQSAEALLRILDDVLDFSKLEAGRIDIEPEPCDPEAVCESVVHLLRAKAEDKGLTLTSRMLPSVPPLIVADPARLRQILLNLVGNAIKFTSSGYVAVRARRGADLPDGRFMMEFEIEDTGIGISPEAERTLFQRFTQADSTITRRFGGTGLGLAICKDLCRLMGGTIRVDSAPGQGSVFTFTIACRAADSTTVLTVAAVNTGTALPPSLPHSLPHSLPMSPPAPPPGGANGVPSADPALPPLRVLVVDDNEVNRNVAAAMLTRVGHSVAFATNGIEAVDAVMQQPFDLVLMDLQMPEMDGLMATQRIRQMPPPQGTLPIVAFTAHASSGTWATCAEVGMDALATKPVRPKLLFAAMAEAMEKAATRPLAPVPAPTAPDAVLEGLPPH